ncbi:MAG: site-2 protease family protein [Syntrophorhabdaceae bacterium]|nr:site-2 protease family protein [Syntrophorhabdaceae bacterium]
MIHILLFLLTFASTYFVGGFYYSISIMIILLAHEMGHYFMSRRYRVHATLPYFIPFPLSPFGTFGAIIRMKGIIIDKKALFDIGAAGPVAGFIVALPFIVIGIKLSSVQLRTADLALLQLGDPLLFKILQRILIGEIPPNYDLVLHPVAYAGWVGLFVTALNLLPVGQLDGGHIIYAVFGGKSRWIFMGTIILLAFLAIFYNPGWIALVILLAIFGMRHPRPLDLDVEIDTKRKWIALFLLCIFALSFTPSPFPSLNIFKENGIPV